MISFSSCMSKEHRLLLMRANRLLGAALVEHNLIKIEDLEQASQKLLELVSSDQPRSCTILGILAFDMKVLKEDDVLHHLVEAEGLGLVDLREYEIPDEVKRHADLDACWDVQGEVDRAGAIEVQDVAGRPSSSSLDSSISAVVARTSTLQPGGITPRSSMRCH